MDGVLVVDKPVGLTSHDVVATARRALGISRVGHTGTLDPNASGVLPLVLGRATRLARYLSADDKEYEATIRFGVTTDSYDAAGVVTGESSQLPSREALDSALEKFRGAFDQMPPAFSAKKIGGKPAYLRARRDKAVTLQPVRVSVKELEVLAFTPPYVRLRLVSSAGFYVRSLAHDLGQALGCGAILDGLRRSRAGAFKLADAVSFAVLASGDRSAVERSLTRLDALLPDLPAVALTPELVRRVRNGVDLDVEALTGYTAGQGLVRLFGPGGEFIGLAQAAKTAGFLHPAVIFG